MKEKHQESVLQLAARGSCDKSPPTVGRRKRNYTGCVAVVLLHTQFARRAVLNMPFTKYATKNAHHTSRYCRGNIGVSAAGEEIPYGR